MIKQTYTNLPVKNLEASKAFFSKLGFTFNPQFTDQNAACMILNENSFVMLVKEEFFKSFISKEITDAKSSTEVLLGIGLESRQTVDDMMKNALAAGAKESRDTQDHGWMYSRAFDDLDGHIWDLFWMDIQKFSES